MKKHSTHHSSHEFRRRVKKLIIPVTLLILLIAIGVFFFDQIRHQDELSVRSDNQVNVKAGYREVTYRGEKYRYNNQIRTILFAGLDSEGEMLTYAAYTGAARADSIALLVLDGYHHKMTIISLSRDTMTEIHRFTLDGKDMGLVKDHLSHAFTYGNGGEPSCKNLCDAVSNLFYGIPVQEYMVINRSAITGLSQLIGPVSVVVPNDDLAEKGYLPGEEVTIDVSNVEMFIRSRDTAVDFSNAGRMERQKAYINGAVKKIRSMVNDDSTVLWDKVRLSEKYMRTSITRNQYLDLTNLLNNCSYSDTDFFIPDGNNITTARYDEFYVDEEHLMEKVIELFYIKI